MNEAIEALTAEHERLCRLNGRLEMAARIQEWVIRNRSRLPDWAVTELAEILTTALESDVDPSTGTNLSLPVSTREVRKMKSEFDSLRIMGLPEVSSSFGGLTPSPLYERVRDGLLTMPVSCGGQRTGWPAGEIREILRARISGATDDEVRQLVIRLETERTGRPAAPRRKHRAQMAA